MALASGQQAAAYPNTRKGDMDDEEAQFKFVMPRGSGLLELHISMNRNRIEFPIMELEWTGEKFSIKTKYKELPEL